MRWAAAALLPVLATAHPSNLQCDDPRFREGGIMMHNWVTDNQFTDGMVLATSKKTYKPGDTIGLTVATNGTKFAGAFFAIQSLAWCTLTGDHGTFGSLAGPLQQGCLSSFFTNASFSGTASATWTAGPDTAGPVTIRIIWGNGPSASDPLSKQGVVVVPDSYLYTKTVTLTNEVAPVRCPAITPGVDPQPPPPKKGSKGSCVHNGVCPGEGVNSPVFIQSLRNDEGEQTFPSAKCIPCRIDHRHRCKSAMVTCPTSWTSPAPVEKIWLKSKSCSGEPDRVVELPRAFAHCPAPSHYSAEEKHLDLERFVPKLQRDHKSYFPDEATARAAIREYRRMLTLIQQYPDQPAVPSKLVDLVWHDHILDTKQYRRDCLRLFGRFIHHSPSFGGGEEKAELAQQQQAMMRSYQALFGDPAPAAIWPAAPRKKDHIGKFNFGTPDCCSALCAKPDCHGCLGCNSVDCGYMGPPAAGGPRTSTSRQLSPEVFAGYVPASRQLAAQQDAPPDTCSVQPQPGMNLTWHICKDQIYFRQTLDGPGGGWFGIGISGREPFVDMSRGDYTLTLPTGNMSGVKDAYRWQPGNGYPCFDIEYECSDGNQTKGTADVRNAQIVRTTKLTYSTWSRALRTGDPKDRDIAAGSISVMFARGSSDYLYYHPGGNVCLINFFDGATDCRESARGPKQLRGSTDLVRTRH
eukprot:TRINITY_DN244_c0_g1_i2.p2 TRINITY_DN244_c0_g1~~TRINITY_DN244_c0_g1_i2.p2  ORF type:complete len:716 (+),score=253.35 TRINITY_DN244_c0_g1_i2:81-2150(+)